MGVERFDDIKGLTSNAELVFLHDVAKSAPAEGKIVELGTFNGKATATLCEAVGDRRVVTIDNWVMKHHGDNGVGLVKHNLATHGFSPKIISGSSTTVPKELRYAYSVAMLFVDTDHVPQQWIREMNAWLPYLQHDGVVAAHDYNDDRYQGFTSQIDLTFMGWEKLGIVEHMIAARRNYASS